MGITGIMLPPGVQEHAGRGAGSRCQQAGSTQWVLDPAWMRTAAAAPRQCIRQGLPV